MAKRHAAHLPTTQWLFFNRLRDWLAFIFIFTLLAWGIAIYAVRYSLAKDCENLYHRRTNLFGMWVKIDAGSNKKECPKE